MLDSSQYVVFLVLLGCVVLCSLVEQSVLFGFEVRNFDCVVSVACCAESCSVVEETVTEFAWCHRSHRALRVRRICTQGLSAIMSPGAVSLLRGELEQVLGKP